MGKRYCILNVSTVGEHDGPDAAIVEITPKLIECLERYSRTVAAMTETPAIVEYNDGSVSFVENLHTVEDCGSIFDPLSSAPGQPLFLKVLPQGLEDLIKHYEEGHFFDLFTVVIRGRSPMEYRWSGQWNGSDISFVTTTEVTLEALKSALNGGR